ncbi:unnamed protein product [Rotaria magnacalcarata]|uniref:Transmembrane protein 45B n=1 Tax=Rotaria magnacalcarata TaxID=392030 RepID=A0A817AAA8_9BILA|nr:unnamed protein product [Rotaria magnacalcarata]CAF1316006.1 unnamed protein product [Rotaria magnacalcarata]CAF2200761.1 unnamed protein product [Rotaria magnacalcarata]CAF2201046.1 unnamed protein product [Rotaria magnacalcarata]CAF2255934.1 unnamed protein product [Rotaria magnacalcarata]
MGSLGGHLVPGSIFIILGLWWMYSSWLRYFICRQRRRPYYTSSAFPCHCFGLHVAKLPIESFFVLFGTTLGILIELIAGFNRVVDPETGRTSIYFGANNLQHFAMYGMFFLVALIQLLMHYNFPLPKHFDILAGTLAFAAEALLFYFHGHARGEVEILIHIFLVLAICATVVCGVFELVQKEKQVHGTLMRGYFTVMQGSWFYTTGFFLYSPFHEHYEESKDTAVHRTVMLIAYYFVLHMAIVLFILLALAILAYVVSKRQQQTVDFVEYGQFSMVIDEDEEMEKLNGTTTIIE